MTDDELRHLFEALRLENAAAHTETRHEIAETRRHIDVVNEGTRHEIGLLGEAVQHVREELGRTEWRLDAKIDRSISETQALIRFSHAELDRRLRVLEQRM